MRRNTKTLALQFRPALAAARRLAALAVLGWAGLACAAAGAGLPGAARPALRPL